MEEGGGQEQGGQGGEAPDDDQARRGRPVVLRGERAQHAAEPQQVCGQGEMGLLEGGEGIPSGVLPEHHGEHEAERHQCAGGVAGDEEADGREQRAEGGRGEDGEGDGGPAGAPGLLPVPRLRTRGCPVYAPETPRSTVKTR